MTSSKPYPNQDKASIWQAEINKWDGYYSDLDLTGETDETRTFGNELLQKLSVFLPDGARILEAGCGGGWQSLVLARSGKYRISMLDFSHEALRYAKQVFERDGLSADTVYGNMATPGKPEFDLVFNAGVFEHYTFDEQVDLLKGMASRSRQYVMVIIPNRLCYWYWIWRINAASKGLWTFGKEVPFVDLSKLFDAAGLQYIGQSFMAESWTESFIQLIPEIDDNLKRLILEAHHSPLIDGYQKSYLVAAIGHVTTKQKFYIPGWESSPVREDFDSADLQSIIADTLAEKNVSIKQAEEQIELLSQRLDQAEYDKSELDEIKNSNAWTLVRLLWRTRQRIIPSGSKRAASARKLLISVKSFLRISGIVSFVGDVQRSLADRRQGRRLTVEVSAQDKDDFWTHYRKKKAYYASLLANLHNINPHDSAQINDIIHLKPYKGIVVYPQAVHWEPIQRPHQLLIELGQEGYLCFFCEDDRQEMALEQKSENVYVIYGEKHLLYPLQNFHVLFLCTWMNQTPFIESLPNHYLWYDLIDKLDIFHLYDQDMEHMHYQLVKEADLVTYSGLKLNRYVKERKDALYLPNGVRGTDFALPGETKVPPRMVELLAKGKPIIGYYGALAEWVDQNIIRGLADRHPEWEFVLIGKAWLDITRLENVANIHYLGPVPYAELASYAAHFDVGIIPFVINDLTDCVSPIKLFEYSALGLPVISTPFFEITQYHQGFICLATDTDGFSQAITWALKEETKERARVEGPSFAQINQWRDRVNDVERQLSLSWQGLKTYANYTPYHHIALMTETFFHYDGRGFYAGGAERYLVDLASLLSSLNIKMVVYQYGAYPWMRKYNDLDVISLASANIHLEQPSASDIVEFNQHFYQINIARARLNIFSPFIENWPAALHPSIGISHGISWDSFYVNYPNGIRFWDTNRRTIEAARSCDFLVSVDTNTANWFQTVDYEIGQRIHYVPNYVDLELFHPVEKIPGDQGKVIILYPRRLYRARGLYLLLAVMDEILTSYPQVEFHFVGRGFPEDTKHVKIKQEMWGRRVQWYFLSPLEMPRAYQSADITIIPTLYSEGTSLSCLEAMACGNAVIATRVGGLPDLIINDHNGLLIDPTEAALRNAIVELLDNPEKMTRVQTNGLNVARAFSKRSWDDKWLRIIRQELALEESQVAQPSKFLETKLIDVYCDDFSSDAIHRLLERLLQHGYLIYVRVKDKDRGLVETSFQRLQFLEWEEPIETTPGLIVADPEAGNQLQRVDYLLTGNLDQDITFILDH